ncbi:hypothetical protein DPEC_G00345620 [Dallia pectoralis]|uniref:Uncharacterized protein n=1 Tax=Dallia pectoralis TaxID=75939 RepID=A0ACC2F403_DALPE|nr:hypothetical protein DPEC_G00345620 [Dallia pectoralis]
MLSEPLTLYRAEMARLHTGTARLFDLPQKDTISWRHPAVFKGAALHHQPVPVEAHETLHNQASFREAGTTAPHRTPFQSGHSRPPTPTRYTSC